MVEPPDSRNACSDRDGRLALLPILSNSPHTALLSGRIACRRRGCADETLSLCRAVSQVVLHVHWVSVGAGGDLVGGALPRVRDRRKGLCRTMRSNVIQPYEPVPGRRESGRPHGLVTGMLDASQLSY
jgi:hypothetical protein